MKVFPIEAYEMILPKTDENGVDFENLLVSSNSYEEFLTNFIKYFQFCSEADTKVLMLKASGKYVFNFSFDEIFLDGKSIERSIEAMLQKEKILPSDDYFIFKGDVVKYEIILDEKGFSFVLYESDILEPFTIFLSAILDNFKQGE